MSDTLVIIPTLNEIENIKAIVSKVLEQPKKFDVLVVDDASKDGTPEAVLELMALHTDRLFLERRVGKKPELLIIDSLKVGLAGLSEGGRTQHAREVLGQ